jgi:Na+-transporting NADH:ubiquinone oxidoreductase subunit F
MHEIIIAITIAVGIVLVLSVLVLAARHWLIPFGNATITINERRRVTAALGDKLLWALATNGIMLPAACGGRGSCGQCQLTVVSGAGESLPNEAAHISKQGRLAGERLACMVTIRHDLAIRVDDSALDVRRWIGIVASNHNLTTNLKELAVAVPDALPLQFQAGDYMLVEAPAGQSHFSDFPIDARYRDEWERQRLFDLTAIRLQPEVRAYSIANPPHQKDEVKFVVRIATPPPGAPPGTPPGRVSSYLFGLRAGDEIAVSGPFGKFHARESNAEMIFIGGGAGIAPLRAIILDQLLGKRSTRRISFWYGARDVAEICFRDEFDSLAAEFDNFTWQVALSDASVEHDWSEARGLIHSVVYDQYLNDHAAPDEAEYYLCGPPLMCSAVIAMLEDIGVSPDNIFVDNFGA